MAKKDKPGSSRGSELFKTEIDRGLEDTEVVRREAIYGKNILPEREKVGWFKLLLGQFKDVMNLMLLAISLILFIKAIIEIFIRSNGEESVLLNFSEPIIILLVVVINALLATQQIVRTTKEISSLNKLTSPTAKVLRGGEIRVLDAADIVPGDIIIIETGDLIPADAKLLEEVSLKVIESNLTGEAAAIDKEVSLEEARVVGINRKDYIYSGSHVVAGSARAVVVATGSKTQIGNIKGLVDSATKPKTPLQHQLDWLAKVFAYISLGLFLLSFLLQLLVQNSFTRLDSYINALVNAAALAVGFVPEGLVVFSTAILALNIKELSKQRVLVKGLQTVETLGATSFICTDKTGTLTENKMQLTNYHSLEFGNLGEDIRIEDELKLLLLANEAYQGEAGSIVGDPVDIAIVNLCQQQGIDRDDVGYQIKRILPFTSERKLMSVIVTDGKRNLLVAKGGFDILSNTATNRADLISLNQLNSSWSSQAKRVLGLGIRTLSKNEFKEAIETSDPEKFEGGLKVVSIFALEDPIREGIAQAIKDCIKAKINVAMITGDNKETAIAIAKRAGIFSANSLALDGGEVDQLDDDRLIDIIEEVKVYSRVSPAHKLRIVQLLQRKNHTVTMIGDGINDSPALKSADVGCAMGRSGSDLSKEASDLILVDDSFKTMVEGIYQGRRVFHRIKIVIKNLLISSSACVFAVILGLMVLPWLTSYLGKSTANFYIYTGSQLLYMNLLTHGFPAITLGLIEPDIDPSKPTGIKGRGRRFFHLKDMIKITLFGGLIGILSIFVWAYVALTRGSQLGSLELINLSSSASFIVFGLATVLNALNLLGKGSVLRFRTNYRIVYLAVGLSAILMLSAIFIPGFRDIFNISRDLTKGENLDIILIALSAALVPTILSELGKLYLRFTEGERKKKKITLSR